MQTSKDILDALAAEDRRRGGTGTDYAVSKVLHVTPGRVCDIRAGRQTMSKSLCIRAALYLQIEPAALVTLTAAEREDDPQLKASFLKVASGYLPAVVVAVGMLAHPIARAADCILCKIQHARRFGNFPHLKLSASPALSAAW